MSYNGVGIIFWNRDLNGVIHILTGIETKFLSDLVPGPHSDLYREEYEYLNVPENTPTKTILNEFSRKAETLERDDIFLRDICKLYDRNPHLSGKGLNILFDLPHFKNGHFETNMRFQRHNSTKGIPKGGREPGDTSPENTLKRELFEELGLPIHIIHDNSLYKIGRVNDYILFHNELTNMERVYLMNCIRQYKIHHIGEMLSLQFQPLEEVIEEIKKQKYNKRSAWMITKFKETLFPNSLVTSKSSPTKTKDMKKRSKSYTYRSHSASKYDRNKNTK